MAGTESEFSSCLNAHVGATDLRTRLRGYQSYQDITDHDIGEMHGHLNRLMNLDIREIPTCLRHLEDLQSCHEGSSEEMLTPTDHLVPLLSGTTLQKTTPEDHQFHETLHTELSHKVALAMKNLVKIAAHHEESTCPEISSRTRMLGTIHSGTTMKWELPEINPMELSDTTDNFTFGRRLLNFLALAFVLYMFARLLLK